LYQRARDTIAFTRPAPDLSPKSGPCGSPTSFAEARVYAFNPIPFIAGIAISYSFDANIPGAAALHLTMTIRDTRTVVLATRKSLSRRTWRQSNKNKHAQQ
jgi:hypothetical protein